VIGNDYEPHPEGITTYNFEVEHGHNYFVLAQHDMTTSGSPPVLVHNMCAVNSNTTPKGRILSQHALNDSLARHNIPYGQIKKYIDNVIDECTEVVDQGLNTKAYIKKGVDGKSRYSLVVFNEEKNMIVTALRDLTKGQLNNILSNHRHF
jgi:hypothetical protein